MYNSLSPQSEGVDLQTHEMYILRPTPRYLYPTLPSVYYIDKSYPPKFVRVFAYTNRLEIGSIFVSYRALEHKMNIY